MLDNIILATDSYKLGHWNQYPAGTTGVYSYLEARQGAEDSHTVFFGLQPILRELAVGVHQMDLLDAQTLAEAHFGSSDLFNAEGWYHILNKHGGKLPVRIKAVPEGTVVPVGNVLMTVENTDPDCYWLTNALESVLMHVWYPTTVATLSRRVKMLLKSKLEAAGSPLDGLDFMLHDFGYRGVSSHESAAIGGAAHLVNFKGTDTLPALTFAKREYNADYASLGFSVPATEHSVMTSLGREHELQLTQQLIWNHPTGILSVVADSYDIYAFVNAVAGPFKEKIMERDGVFVVRPDSVTLDHPTPQLLVAWILETLWASYGGTTTPKGFKVLDPHVRVLWGDGIDPHGIEKIVNRAMLQGFSPENLVFGMGGGLLQKVNRDTERFAFKASAMRDENGWRAVRKEPIDLSKASKGGRLALINEAPHGYTTVSETWADHDGRDVLQTVFEDGKLLNEQSFDEIRARASV